MGYFQPWGETRLQASPEENLRLWGMLQTGARLACDAIDPDRRHDRCAEGLEDGPLFRRRPDVSRTHVRPISDVRKIHRSQQSRTADRLPGSLKRNEEVGREPIAHEI